MPLKCDCYPGCWFEHSTNWPALGAASMAGLARIAAQKLAHGTYVVSEDYLRVETRADANVLLEAYPEAFMVTGETPVKGRRDLDNDEYLVLKRGFCPDCGKLANTSPVTVGVYSIINCANPLCKARFRLAVHRGMDLYAERMQISSEEQGPVPTITPHVRTQADVLLKSCRPYIKHGLAFILFAAGYTRDPAKCLRVANTFIEELEEDLKKESDG